MTTCLDLRKFKCWVILASEIAILSFTVITQGFRIAPNLYNLCANQNAVFASAASDP